MERVREYRGNHTVKNKLPGLVQRFVVLYFCFCHGKDGLCECLATSSPLKLHQQSNGKGHWKLHLSEVIVEEHSASMTWFSRTPPLRTQSATHVSRERSPASASETEERACSYSSLSAPPTAWFSSPHWKQDLFGSFSPISESGTSNLEKRSWRRVALI